MRPIYEHNTLARMGFNKVINDAIVLQKAFGEIPASYKNQLNAILEDYDVIIASKKNQLDYLKTLLLLGHENLNEFQTEVLDRYIQSDFNQIELTNSKPGLSAIQMSKVMQMLHLAYKDRGTKLVTREDMQETIDNALDFDNMPPDQIAKTIIQLDKNSVRDPRNARKNRNNLAKVLKQYAKTKHADIEDCTMGRDNFLGLFKTYACNNWKGMDCYNQFIQGFGKHFDDFS